MAEFDDVDVENDEEEEIDGGDMGAIVWPSANNKPIQASGPLTANEKKARFIDLANNDGETAEEKKVAPV